jgi:sarcosine oxidase
MTESFDAIVVGLGAMGSATLLELAKKGLKVLGIDRLTPPHSLGSSHGDTRITRRAIGEGESYSPFAMRSFELFHDLENKVNEALVVKTGGLILGNKGKSAAINHTFDFLKNTLNAANKYQIEHEILEAKDIRRRFPQFKVDDDEIAYYEFGASILRPEMIIKAQLAVAKESGAVIHTNETVLSFEETNTCVQVKTDQGVYEGRQVVLSCGPWLSGMVPNLENAFKVYRQVLYWFDVSESYDSFQVGQMPIFIWQLKGYDHGIYGFPAVDGKDGGFKIASENYDQITSPDKVRREVDTAEIQKMYDDKVAPYFPRVKNRCIKSVVCMYTVTDDSAFVIDYLPSSERIVICSPCSGHGFKHSAAVGETVAELLSTGTSRLDISSFKLSRLLENKAT